MKRVVRFLLRHRRAMLGVHAAVLAIAAYSARRVLVRFQYRDFYAYPGNPQLPKYEEFHRVFSDPAGYVAVMIRARDVFQPQVGVRPRSVVVSSVRLVASTARRSRSRCVPVGSPWA